MILHRCSRHGCLLPNICKCCIGIIFKGNVSIVFAIFFIKGRMVMQIDNF